MCVLTVGLVVTVLFEQHGEASVFAAVCTAAAPAACHEMTERGFAGLTSFFVGLRGAGAEGLGGLDPTEVTCFQWASHETLVVGTQTAPWPAPVERRQHLITHHWAVSMRCHGWSCLHSLFIG